MAGRARPEKQKRQALRIGVVLLEQFTLNAFSGFVDALRLAADRGGRSRQILCGWEIMSPHPVRASCGLGVAAAGELKDPSSFDYVAIAGGNGYLDRRQPHWLDAYLLQAARGGIPLIGLCTGTFNIARAGLMTGYQACVHWNVLEAFREEFPHIDARPDRIFVDAGERITCAGSAGATDLALHLITRHCGPEKAQQSLRHMMLPGARPSSFPQAHFYADLQSVRDTRVRRAVHIMEQCLNEPTDIEMIAHGVGLSTRQLQRRFLSALGLSPAAYYRELRLKYGAWLLAHTDIPISAIANQSGFADGAHFSREFSKRFEVTPLMHRKRTSLSAPA